MTSAALLLSGIAAVGLGNSGGAPCISPSDCFGLGDCVDSRCVCDAWAAGSPDCSVLATVPLPAGDVDAWGWRNTSTPSWAGSFVRDVLGDGRWHGFVGAMTPGFPNRTTSFGSPQVVHLVQRAGPKAGAGAGGVWEEAADAPIVGFQAQVSPLPEAQGGGFVLFSNTVAGSGLRGLMAAHITDIAAFRGENGRPPRMRNVYSPPWPAPAGPSLGLLNQ